MTRPWCPVVWTNTSITCYCKCVFQTSVSWLQVEQISFVMINFMSPTLDHRCPDIWTNIILGVFLWGCLSMRLTFESVDWAKQIALPNVGGPHSVSWSSEQNKKPGPLMSKREPFHLTAWAGTSVFPCLWTQTEIPAHPASWACWILDWNSTIGSHWSPDGWLQILAFLSLRNLVSQFLIINQTCMAYSVSLENPNTPSIV